VDGTGSAVISGSVNTDVVGTYLLEYTYVDSSGLTGNVISRTVNITDQTAPIIAVIGT
jgi:hypothetical protein